MDIYELLADAIRNKLQVIATYKGYERHLCPHTLGTKRGRYHCLFYQFGGYSGSRGPITHDSPTNWMCADIELLHDVSVQEGEWRTFNRHTRRQSCIDRVHVEVEY